MQAKVMELKRIDLEIPRFGFSKRKAIVAVGITNLCKGVARILAGKRRVYYARTLKEIISLIPKAELYYFSYSIEPKLRGLLLIPLLRLLGRKVINHWVGSDVLLLRSRIRRLITRVTHLFIDGDYAVSDYLAKEIREIAGINVDQLFIYPWPIPPKVKELPEELAILAYLPEKRYYFYGGKVIEKIAEDFPQARIYVVANSGRGIRRKHSNIEYLGYLPRKELEKLYDAVRAYVRITKHDGMPFMIIESLLHGRYIVHNHPVVPPHVGYIVKTYSDIKRALEDIAMKKEPNIMGREWAVNFIKRNNEKALSVLLKLLAEQREW